MKYWILLVVIMMVAISSCITKTEKAKGMAFKNDLQFLRQHTDVVVLSDESNAAQVAVCPGLQGRVMTSTATGLDGLSFGWINRELLASKENNLHINAFGGEDRFWLGPEGGQFSVFFKKGDPFDLEHWFTPAPVNEGAFDVVNKAKDRISFRKTMNLKNYSDSEFNLVVDREIRLLSSGEIGHELAISLDPKIKAVGYQSENKLTNVGQNEWNTETGLLSVWILGMFVPSPSTTIVVPYVPGPEAELGPIVNDAYFGKIPANRLVIRESAIFFSGDGKYRSKIGVSPKRAKSPIGSYDAENKVLTLAQYSLHEGVLDYVNSMWEIQDQPYAGDVANSYNDGPAKSGAKPLGPFYELESSSPAAALKPNESLTHLHRTIHLQGPEESLDKIARTTLGVSLAEITNAFSMAK